jgi:hypothetical protein
MRELFAAERARQSAWLADASAPGGRPVAEPLKTRSSADMRPVAIPAAPPPPVLAPPAVPPNAPHEESVTTARRLVPILLVIATVVAVVVAVAIAMR